MTPAKVVVCRLETINGVECWVPYTSPSITASELDEAIDALRDERWRREVEASWPAWEAAPTPMPGGGS